MRGGGEENEAFVQVLAIALERELGVFSELEVEIEATGGEGVEEDGMRGLERVVVEEHQEAAVGWGFRRE